jgi:hypothetical protein
MHQQLWGYKVEEKLYMGVREQKRLNTTGRDDREFVVGHKDSRGWSKALQVTAILK